MSLSEIPTLHLITYISAAISLLISTFLVLLIIKNRAKERSSWFLIGWIFLINFVDQIVSTIIISLKDPILALKFYQINTPAAIFVTFFYFFVNDYLKLKAKRWMNFIAITYIILIPVACIIWPSILIKGVIWDNSVQFYIADYNFNTVPFFYIGLLFWIYAIFKLIEVYRNCKSIKFRNRIKYLIIGGVLPLVGFILVSVPFTAIRKYPLDMLAITIGSISLVYGAIRYKTIDLGIVVKKGLVYTIVTSLVTGVYLFLALLTQKVLGLSQFPVSIPAAFATALVIAFIYQPLLTITQSVIDKVFFRKSYDTHELISKFSDAITSTIDLTKLGDKIVTIISSTLKVEKIALLVLDEKNENFEITNSTGIENPRKIKFQKDSSLIEELEKIHDVVSAYDLSEESKDIFKKLKFEILIPLFTREKLVGILGLGKKLSEEFYALDEYQLLDTLGNQVAVGLENARLFTEVGKEKSKIEALLEHEIEIDKQKSEFIMIASHNLRTPLTVIKGYLEYFKSSLTQRSDEDKENLSFMSNSVQELSYLVEELLTVASMEKENVSLAKEVINPYDLGETAVKKLQDRAKQKGLSLEFEASENIHTIIGDPLKLSVVLNNLLDNAIKFTTRGEVKLKLRGDNDKITFEVKDTGLGIPKTEISNLFTKFHQIRQTQFEAIPGIGLGLYIVKLITKAHNGDIKVESEESKGTSFFLTLPVSH